MSQQLWGLDLGGTKIEGVVLKSKEEPEVLFRSRIDTEANQGYEHILNRIKALMNTITAEVGESPKHIGIGTPGKIDPPTGLMKNSNTLVLNDRPFQRDLEKILGKELIVANDANCFALAETKIGAVPQADPKAKVVFGVIMGTGAGGGLVVNGTVIQGKHGIGGEWGHNFLDASGGPCYCGKVGCVEKVIAGPALEKFYSALSGAPKKLKTIIELARQGNDQHAVATLDRLIKSFGKALSVIINITDPDVIVLGGGVGNIDELYTLGVAEVQKHIFNNTLETKIVKPKLGDSAGVFGAAFLVS
jgi:predicted NBD/HSP70 family sugar kinase